MYDLAFYSHIPIAYIEDEIYTYAFMGSYVEGLAHYSERFLLVAHSEQYDPQKHDFKFSYPDIEFFNLGFKTSAPHRFFAGLFILKTVWFKLRFVKKMIIRVPSPLGWWFRAILGKRRTHYLIVGDEREGARSLKILNIRRLLQVIYLFLADLFLLYAVKGTRSFSNSIAVMNRYVSHGVETRFVSTTILNEKDLCYRENSCCKPEIKLLYTGRIDESKGLQDTLEAMFLLRNKGFNLSFHIVGWEDGSDTYTDNLKIRSVELGLDSHLIFHGKKKIGEELNAFYRCHDIYIMSSYSEGFPRTIWEAMGNGLPVISTNVGGIPYLLEDKVHAIIVSPMDPMGIAVAIENIILNKDSRLQIIKNAYKLASQFTMQNQQKLLIDNLF